MQFVNITKYIMSSCKYYISSYSNLSAQIISYYISVSNNIKQYRNAINILIEELSPYKAD